MKENPFISDLFTKSPFKICVMTSKLLPVLEEDNRGQTTKTRSHDLLESCKLSKFLYLITLG